MYIMEMVDVRGFQFVGSSLENSDINLNLSFPELPFIDGKRLFELFK